MSLHRQQAFLSRLGFGGVSPLENQRARTWSRRFEAPMTIAALWILVDWYLREKGIKAEFLILFTDWLIWLCFIAETSVMLYMVNNKRRYLAQNWMNLLIILAGLPILWGVDLFYAGALRSLRLLIILGIFLRISTDIRAVLAQNNLGMTLFICFLILLFAGFLISGIDPAFETPLDGVWWALVTVATVGYGDLVPSTTGGRIFGAFLILMGVGLFSMLTASFSAFFVAKDEQATKNREIANSRRLTKVEAQLDRMEHMLARLSEHLEQQEQSAKAPPTKPDPDSDNETQNPPPPAG